MESDDRFPETEAVLSSDYDPTAESSLVLQIVRMVAIASDCDVSELEPLHRVIDTDALDAIVSRSGSGDHVGLISLSFVYEGYRVDVAGNQVRLLSGT